MILVRFIQSKKAIESILVTPFGIVTSVRLEQPLKAYHPMLVTLLGMEILVRLVHL